MLEHMQEEGSNGNDGGKRMKGGGREEEGEGKKAEIRNMRIQGQTWGNFMFVVISRTSSSNPVGSIPLRSY